MKKYLFGLLFVLCTSNMVLSAAPKHRNHLPQIEATDTAAYSDTSSVSAAANAVQAATDFDDDDFDDDFDAPGNIQHVKALIASVGGVGVVIGVLIGLFIIAIVIPIVLIVMLVRYLIKRQESQVQLTQKAMELGVPLPKSAQPAVSLNRLWTRGVTNITVGIGLFFMFLIMGMESLSGIGLLIACIGAGTLYMARRIDKQQQQAAQNETPAQAPAQTDETPAQTTEESTDTHND